MTISKDHDRHGDELRKLRAELAALRHERDALQRQLHSQYASTIHSNIDSRLISMVDVLPQIIWVADAQGNHKYFNRAWEELSGCASVEVSGHGWAEAIHPEDRQVMLKLWQLAIETGEPFELEFRVRRQKDGAYRWYLSRGLPHRDAKGSILSWFGTCTDIHDKKMMEEALQSSERRYRAITEILHQIVWATNAEGEGTFFNEWGRQYCGMNMQDAEQGRWTDAIDPAHRERVLVKWQQALKNGGYYEVEMPLRRAVDGMYRWHLVQGIAVRGSDQRIVEWIGIGIDIHDRKVREETLVKLSDMALKIYAATSVEDVMALAAHESRTIIGCHQAVASTEAKEDWRPPVTSVSVSEKYASWEKLGERSGIDSLVAHLNLPLRLSREQVDQHPKWRALAMGEGCPPLFGYLAVPLVGRDGNNLGVIQLSEKEDDDFTAEDEAVLTQVARTVSLAIENVRLTRELREADRKKDEFLALLSHELRSPLNVIGGHIELLRLEEPGSPEHEASLAAIERNAQAQEKLISDLLDVSRIITGKLKMEISTFDLAPVVQAAVESVRFAAEIRRIYLRIFIAPNLGAITGEPTRIQQIIWNLLSNAVKFTPPGGHVKLIATRIRNGVEFKVSDTGRGVAPEFLPYIFDRFRQEDAASTRRQGGLGLGLSIVRHFTELHGGRVAAESEGRDKGATFIVTIPDLGSNAWRAVAATDAPSDEALVHQASRARLLSGVSVLAIDDHQDVRDLVCRVLQKHGAEVTVAASGYEGLALLDTRAFDVLICDIGMPDFDGFSTIREWRRREKVRGVYPVIPAAALTAFASDKDRDETLAAGFQAHLTKPIRIAELVDAIRDLLPHGRRPRS